MSREKEHNQPHHKASNLGWILLGVLAVVILVFFIAWNNQKVYTSTDYSDSLQGAQNEVKQNCQEKSIPYEEQEEYLKTEYYNERVPYTDKECENKNLIYSITNDRWAPYACNHISTQCTEKHWYGDSNCSDFCTDRIITYSVDLNNQDDQAGTWAVNINFYKSDGTTLYKSIPITQSLYPHTTQTFTGSTRITSDSPSGDANQQYTARYAESNIPTKQVCKDVIKYQDVQRERQVTAYKPVTKYKTERVCN